MQSKFVNYSRLVSYLGVLDQNSIGLAIKGVIDQLPKFIEYIDSDIRMLNVKGTQLLDVKILFSIRPGLLSEEEKLEQVKRLKEQFDEALTKSFSTQKVIFNLELD